MRELERDRSEPAPPGSSPALPRLAVIGNGRVGGSVADNARTAGLDISVVSHGQSMLPALRPEAGSLVVLLCVPDRAIAAVCEDVARTLAPAAGAGLPHSARTYVGHTSGAGGLDVLQPALDRGAATFTLHPLQTIPHPGMDLTGAPCAVSGSSDGALVLARQLADRLGMLPFEVAEEARTAYHAAAVIAANFLVALEESAVDLLDRAGVADARTILAPLVLTSAANWAATGGAALTGPIARGDESTVAGHLEALRRLAPELVPMYEALAQRTRRVAATNAAGEHDIDPSPPRAPRPTDDRAEVRP
jgi:predicted short-subunit dehydrogenase-like oxidoreductase (DUF2520 family)